MHIKKLMLVLLSSLGLIAEVNSTRFLAYEYCFCQVVAYGSLYQHLMSLLLFGYP